MPRPIYFNGKFYSGGLNGVQRVADRLIRECDDGYSAPYGDYVADDDGGGSWHTRSFTLGPKSTDPVPTLWVTLEGNMKFNAGIPTLNDSDAKTCIGRVVTLPGERPELTIDGIEDLPEQPALAGAYNYVAPSTPDPVSTLNVTLTYVSAVSEDTDDDEDQPQRAARYLRDDKCRYVSGVNACERIAQ